MADEDKGNDDEVWPESFRRFLRRFDPSVLPGRAGLPALGPGSVTADAGEAGREPDAEVVEGPDAVYVTVDLPGISWDDVDLRVTGTALVVSASSPSRKYYREIPLPARVLAEPTRATCANGVLDVTLAKMPADRRVAVG